MPCPESGILMDIEEAPESLFSGLARSEWRRRDADMAPALYIVRNIGEHS